MQLLNWRAACALLWMCVVLAGCQRPSGPDRQPIVGEVTVNGRLLADGRIRFLPAEKSGIGGSAGVKAGQYEIPRDEGLPPGEYRVEIEQAIDLGFPLDDDQAFAARGAKPLPTQRIPAKYNRESTLTATIVAATEPNEFNFPLEFPEPDKN
jgi:hypothetical protein